MFTFVALLCHMKYIYIYIGHKCCEICILDLNPKTCAFVSIMAGPCCLEVYGDMFDLADVTAEEVHQAIWRSKQNKPQGGPLLAAYFAESLACGRRRHSLTIHIASGHPCF